MKQGKREREEENKREGRKERKKEREKKRERERKKKKRRMPLSIVFPNSFFLFFFFSFFLFFFSFFLLSFFRAVSSLLPHSHLYFLSSLTLSLILIVPLLYSFFSFILSSLKIYVIDSADRRRMEETGVELQQLLDEVRVYGTPVHSLYILYYNLKNYL